MIDGDVLREDPVGHGIVHFANGITAYAFNSGRGLEVEGICENGSVAALNNGSEWEVREPVEEDHRGRRILGYGTFPAVPAQSSTLCLIEDLVHCLDTGAAPRGGVRLARSNTELLFAFVESHLRRGARVDLPLQDSRHRLERAYEPRQPKFEAQD